MSNNTLRLAPYTLTTDTAGNILHIERDDGEEWQFDPSETVDSAVVRQADLDDLDTGGQEEIDLSGVLEPEAVEPQSSRGDIPWPAHHTAYDPGTEQDEIVRFTLASGEALDPRRLETRFKGGGTDSDFWVDVYDASADNVLISTSSRSASGDVSTAGATILIRVSNQTGAEQRASITGQATIVEA